MIKLLFIYLISFTSFATTASNNLLECHTEHSSIYLELVASGRGMKMTVVNDSAYTIKTSTYLTELSTNQRIALSDGSFGLPFVNIKNESVFLLIENNSSGKFVNDGFIQNISCSLRP